MSFFYDIAGTSAQFNTYTTWSIGAPIDISFDLTAYSGILSATLSLVAYDVDVMGIGNQNGLPEFDVVSINGNALGTLSGADNQVQTSLFTFDVSSLIQNAINHVTVYNVTDPTWWGFSVNSASLRIETSKAVPAPEVGAGLGLGLAMLATVVVRKLRQAA